MTYVMFPTKAATVIRDQIPGRVELTSGTALNYFQPAAQYPRRKRNQFHTKHSMILFLTHIFEHT